MQDGSTQVVELAVECPKCGQEKHGPGGNWE
jgi:hypothetical protein